MHRKDLTKLTILYKVDLHLQQSIPRASIAVVCAGNDDLTVRVTLWRDRAEQAEDLGTV